MRTLSDPRVNPLGVALKVVEDRLLVRQVSLVLNVFLVNASQLNPLPSAPSKPDARVGSGGW